MRRVRVRYAPSPTGHLHIGNARTALFNYLFAKHNNGDFIIRVEDTDVARNIEGGEKSQLDNLKWLGIQWDESIDKEGDFGPYNQLERHAQGIYTKYVDELLESGKAYKCFCTSKELEAEAEKQKASGLIPKYSGKCRHLTAEEVKQKSQQGLDYTVRFKTPENVDYSWSDIVKSDVTFNSKDVSGDFNILKRDGIPTYNFAVVIDDYLMEITHILRGEDHISNTPKQLMIYEALGWEVPTFGHMTLIVNEEGKKLSKRDEGIIQFISQYKELGFLPEAMFNFITLLGWSPDSEEEIFTQEQLIDIFDANRLSKSAAKFDVNKLSWINNQYIKKMDNDKYLDLVMPFINEIEHSYSEDTIRTIALLYKEQISYGKEIIEVSKLFFEAPEMDAEALEFMKQEGITETISLFRDKISAVDEISEEAVKPLIKEVQKELQVKGKMLFMPIRISTTMQMHGPELAEILSILGKDKIIDNMNKCIEEINS